MAAVKSQTERCLDLLALLAEAGEPRALGDIAQALDLPKSAAHRLVSQLVEHGWARQDEATGFYDLTLRMTLLGQRFLERTGLPGLYQPVLERLAHETEAYARIAVVEHDSLIWVGEAQGARSGLMYQPEMGGEIRLNVTANGKVWLASLPEPEALRLVLAQGIGGPDRYGPRAITDIDALRAELRVTRERGYGLSVEEGEAGVVAVAAAIALPGEAGGTVVGSVSVAGPVARITPARYGEVAQAVGRAARELAGLWPLRWRHRGGAARREETTP